LRSLPLERHTQDQAGEQWRPQGLPDAPPPAWSEEPSSPDGFDDAATREWLIPEGDKVDEELPEPEERRLDINAVRFEDLRGLGLSVSQSARVIATRDVRSGFKSLKELDDLDDLPNEVVSRLKQRVRV
jgi:hypothetical protein